MEQDNYKTLPSRILTLEWRFYSLIMKFENKWIYKDNWGTKSDWCKYLHWKSPTGKEVQSFVELLISQNILIEKGSVIRQNTTYQRFELAKDFKTKMKIGVIENNPVMVMLDQTDWYEIREL